MNKIIIDGKVIQTANEVYKLLKQELDFGPYFGNNLDALWDVLSTDVERPFAIYWINAEVSKRQLGNDFNLFIELFQKLEEYDRSHGLEEKFNFFIDHSN